MTDRTDRGAEEKTGRARSQAGSRLREHLLWGKAQDFAEVVAEVVAALPHDRVADAIGSQLVRSAASISANIAEGYGRFSQAAYRNHLSVARGSAFESESWIDLLVRRGYVGEPNAGRLLAQCDELQRLLTVRMKALAEGKTYAIRELAEERYEV